MFASQHARVASSREAVLVVPALFDSRSTPVGPTGLLATATLPPTPAPAATGFVLAFDEVQDPGNRGTLIRTAAAAGVQQVWLSSGGAFAWRVKTLRAEQGVHFHTRVMEDVALDVALRGFNGKCWATRQRHLGSVKVVSLFDAEFGVNNVLVLSNEGHGLTAALQSAITDGVSIPIAAGVESLNVATAGVIVLYSVARRLAASLTSITRRRCAEKRAPSTPFRKLVGDSENQINPRYSNALGLSLGLLIGCTKNARAARRKFKRTRYIEGFQVYFRQFVDRCFARSRRGCGGFAFALAVILSFLPHEALHAQATSARCLQVLTAEQVRTVFGAGLEVAAQNKVEAGVSECSWSRLGNASGVGPSIRVQFFDRVAISANPVAHSVDGFFDMIASTAEEIAGRKREVVAGVATRAVTIQGNSQLLLVVQRSDGVARVILGNVSKAQANAMARAISAASTP